MKNGQAALEFLMTYGWAILVVLAAIAALAFFGVLNPGRFLPSDCNLPSGFACLDFQGTTTSINLVIQNSLGTDVNAVTVQITNGTNCAASNTLNGSASLVNGAKSTYVMTYNANCTPPSGKFRANILLNYTNQDTTLAHMKTGVLIIQIP
jgi:hypothetical protein